MDGDMIKLFFALIRSGVCGEALSEDERALYSEECLSSLLSMGKSHDVDHLIALGLKNSGLLSGEAARLENLILKTAFRFERLDFEYKKLCETLEKAKIPFLPLKGSVLRGFYPEPWMRTSCDIDVLVHTEDTDRAVEILKENLGYRYEGTGSHDISLFTPGGLNVELHYELVEDSISEGSAAVLKNAWELSHKKDGFLYHFEMPDELFYFYHLAHMAKHFANGGCGIRPFIDIWILNHRVDFDEAARAALLTKGGLSDFSKQASLLSEVWLGNADYTPTAKSVENYILRGGVYGSAENRITVQQQKKGGKLKFALSRIFIPYETIKFYYPVLQKHRALTPVFEVVRWFKLLFCGGARRSVNELKFNSSLSEEQAEDARGLLNELGL